MGLLARSSRSTSATKTKKSTSNGGYISEFLDLVLAPNVDLILEKKLKIVTNAGGLDPVGLKDAIVARLDKLKVGRKLKVASVSGDDLYPQADVLARSGAFHGFDPLSGAGVVEDGVPDGRSGKKPLSINAYIGAEPITEALRHGADIVVTGRCVDSALVVGPLAFEFGWPYTNDVVNLDRIASASLAGHIVECGAQAIGGNYTDWKASAFSPHGGWANMGYPILTFFEDNGFTISKPDRTGGVVTCRSVCEQMLYEVLDPENYVLPDVVLDMTQVRLEQVASDVVSVRGARGKVPTPWLKCTSVEQRGYRIAADILVCGEEAVSKAKVLGKAILDRTNALAAAVYKGYVPPIAADDSEVHIIGAEFSLSPTAMYGNERREVVLRVAARHMHRGVLDILSKETAPFLTNSCPGICLLTSGRPKSSPNFVASSVLVRRECVVPVVHVGSGAPPIAVPLRVEGCQPVKPAQTRRQADGSTPSPPPSQGSSFAAVDPARIKLYDIAFGRSGDKGDTANIAIVAKDPSYYPYLLEQLTPEVIFSAFRHFIAPGGTVTRFEVPGVHGVNFVLTKSLGGGGLSSLRLDRYVGLCRFSDCLEMHKR